MLAAVTAVWAASSSAYTRASTACTRPVSVSVTSAPTTRPPALTNRACAWFANQAPWRTVEDLAAASGGTCRHAYVDPNTIDGLQDAPRRERLGLRTLRASRITPPDGPAEDVGLLLELPAALP